MTDTATRAVAVVTAETIEALQAAAARGLSATECSLDLRRSREVVDIDLAGFTLDGIHRPWPEPCKPRTIYWWNGTQFQQASRYNGALIKLVPTDWGPPTFEIDGIKMLPTAKVSPWDDAKRKVSLVHPRGARILDCCGGLGYFAAAALAAGAANIQSFEKNDDVLWLRTVNPWSPKADPALKIYHNDISEVIGELPIESFDAVLHDPPRFGIAGELYSQRFYDQLARVLRPGGGLFHYTGTPNKLTSGRNVPAEVSRRLEKAGFNTRLEGDGVLARRR
jgi:predicted methyltransferase